MDSMKREERIESLLSEMSLTEKVSLLAGMDGKHTAAIPRLGVRSIKLTDGPHGVNWGSTVPGATCDAKDLPTAFPTGTAMAATWNPELLRQAGAAMGRETLNMGGDVLLGPCVNIIRHPLAGRTFESFSEDPHLVGRLATGYIQGVQSENVGTSIKHFACNNQEIERYRSSSNLDERTLRELYLPGFETAVKEAHPWTVMCSYNRINGEYAAQHHWLLREVLKDEWGFDGVVVSDWGAVHATVESIEAGLDLEMPGPARYYGDCLADAAEKFQTELAYIDDAARRLLRLIARGGGLDEPADLPHIHPEEHRALARRVAEEAVVLLKNDNRTLPLAKNELKSLAVLGPNAETTFHSGGGSSCARPPYVVSVLDGLREALGESVQVTYEQGAEHFDHLFPELNTEWFTPADSEGKGFRAELFDRPNFDGEPAVVRTDPHISYWWCFGKAPTPKQYAVRWTARMQVDKTGTYRIVADHTGWGRLYLDGECVLESRIRPETGDPERCRTSVTLELDAETSYEFRYEFINDTTEMFTHCKVMGLYRPTEQEQDAAIASAAQAAGEADAAVVVVGGIDNLYESEGADRHGLELPGRQNDLIRAVRKANPNTIVVINTGAPMTLPWLDDVPGVLMAWYGGMEVGRAVTNVLLGQTNPSGKLPMTFPKRIEDTPAFNNYPGGRDVNYGEGIFVGYRHYEARDIEPLLPFGHGLSYTDFQYDTLHLSSETIGPDDRLTVKIDVTNTGNRDGAEIVQLYIADPQSRLQRPPKELKAFRKVELPAGKHKTVTFELDASDLCYFDAGAGGWVVEPGEFQVHVGASSADIRCSASFRYTTP